MGEKKFAEIIKKIFTNYESLSRTVQSTSAIILHALDPAI